MKKIFFLRPSSFCMGVDRAVNNLKEIAEDSTQKIFCVHELIHNPNVNNFFKEKGVQFVESHTEIMDPNATIIFSAHGTNRTTIHDAQTKFKKVINLECPLVTKIYLEIDHFLKQGIETFFYIGKNPHQEADNIVQYIIDQGGEVHRFLTIEKIPQVTKEKKIAVLSQTTLNFLKVQKIMEAIKQQYPLAQNPAISDICKATYERQQIIHDHIEHIDTLIVIGGANSSNTKELVKIGEKNNTPTFFAESLEQLVSKFHEQELLKHKNIAITGGASTPLTDIQKVSKRYEEQGYAFEILELNRKNGK